MDFIIKSLKVIFATIGVLYLVSALVLGTWVLLDLVRVNFHNPVVSTTSVLEGK